MSAETGYKGRNPNKKQAAEAHKRKRILVNINTGSRLFRSEKDYDRQKVKNYTRKETAENVNDNF